MSPHCVWIITTGGYVDKLRTFITNPNIVMLTELGQYMQNILQYSHLVLNVYA